MLTKEELIAFEKDIEAVYKTGVIRGPIHLRDGLEDQLISIFQHEVEADDYVFATWGSHLHALLKGVPAESVKKEILEGRSITLMFPEHKFYTSAIVGGIAPVAVGAAMAIKRQGKKNKVVCFVGDMAVQAGIVNEAIRYSQNFDLPILWVVEDNGKSVGTPTEAAWGGTCESYLAKLFHFDEQLSLPKEYQALGIWCAKQLRYFRYILRFPHAGIGVFLNF